MPQLIESDGNGPSLTPKDVGQFLLRLNQLRQTLLRHPIARRRTGCHIRTHLLHTGLPRSDACGDFVFWRKRNRASEPALLLDPNLSGNPFAAPEIGPITILQFDSQFAGVGIVPLQLAFHEHQPLFELIHRDTG